MHEIAGKRRRFGYRRIGVMLEREGFTMNEKKLYRIYKEEGLSVRRRRGRKRARGTRAPMPIPNRPNVRWSLDFVSDTFGASRKFRILAVNDDCTRENLGLIADTSLTGARVARELTAMIRIYGKPGECQVFCVLLIRSMLPERSKDDDDFQRVTGRTVERLRAT